MKQLCYSAARISLPALIFLLPMGFASAQTIPYAPIVPLPGINYADVDTELFLRTLYILAISFAAFLAVVKLTLAGFKYIGSSANAKGSAKADIQGAIVGLLLILGAVAILRVINPGLLSLPMLGTLPELQAPAPYAETVTTSSGGRNEEAVVKSCTDGEIRTRGSGRNKRTVCCPNDGSSSDILCTNEAQ